jgi:UDP-GlcNAc:undecaprenyl-phosphate GlcNAc-1-phosphate transferase
MSKYLLSAGLALVLSLIFTPLAIKLADRLGAIDLPSGRKVHSKPTPRSGGIAIFAAVALSLLIAAVASPFVAAPLFSNGRTVLVLSGGALLITLLGLADDRRPLRARTKLFIELAIAAIITASGYRVTSAVGVGLGVLTIPLTILWLIAIPNAFNLVDGLDGLAAGIATLVTATLFLLALHLQAVPSALVLALLGGALLGYLPYNFHPAKVFLGDCGSLFLGFTLGTISIATCSKLTTLFAILVPLLVLGLPLAEMLITVLRRMLRVVRVLPANSNGQYQFRLLGLPSLFTADRDHIHHRLLALGITHRRAVLILYGGCLTLCALALGLVTLRAPQQALLAIAVGVISITAVRRLHYDELRPLRNGWLLPILDAFRNRGSAVSGLADLGFVVLACFLAFVIRSDGQMNGGASDAFRQSLPTILAVQMTTLIVSGTYRRTENFGGVSHLGTIAQSVVLAVSLSWLVEAVISYIEGRPYTGVSIVVLDGYLLASLTVGSRVVFRLLEGIFSERVSPSRVLIYGAGRSGNRAFKTIQNKPSLGMRVIGFLDDDSRKHLKLLHKVTIFGPSDLKNLLAQQAVDEILVSSRKIDDQRMREVAASSGVNNLVVRRASADLSEVGNLGDRELTGDKPITAAEANIATLSHEFVGK